MVGVEPHVLRYWEEEMCLKIERNNQGKRCYTPDNVEQLRRIKYWKDKGMQLKAVKEVMEGEMGAKTGVTGGMAASPGWTDFLKADIKQEDGMESGESDREIWEKAQEADRETWGKARESDRETWEEAQEADRKTWEEAQEVGETERISCDLITVENPSDSVKRFEEILDGIIGQALERNNEKLIQEICDAILREMEDKMEERLEELLQRAALRDMVEEGEREAAASGERRSGKRGIVERWRRWLERRV